MKTLKLIIFLGLVGIYAAKAQQTPLYTQYMFNDFVINPAVAGTANYYQARSVNRIQWVGISGAPVTNTISAYGPHTSKPIGYGGYIYSDVSGPTSYTSISGTFAYNVPLNNDIRLSMGLAPALLQYKLDGTKITTETADDPTLPQAVSTDYVFDAAVGLYLWASNFNVGFAAQHLLNNKLTVFDVTNAADRLKTNFYLTGGYKYFINREWAIEPSVLFMGSTPVPLQMDLSGKVIYKNMLWGALSFRTNDALSFIFGYVHENKFYIGAAFDATISKVAKYGTGGSYELMLGYKFNNIKNVKKK
jgi:type IX secretion system PorP/SprF family membrane protein